MWEVEKCVKKRKNHLAIMIKYGTYVNQHVQPYFRTKFGDFSLENKPRNVKRAWPIKRSIMRIFNEAEPQ